MSNEPKYHRVLLKLSGEGLMGQQKFGLEPSTVARICKEVKSVHDQGVQISLVIGAGNIFRGVSGAELGIERTSADYMGMLATVINAIAVQSALEGMGVNTRVLSAIPMSTVCEPISAAAPSDTWSGAGLSFLLQEPETPFLPQIQQQH